MLTAVLISSPSSMTQQQRVVTELRPPVVAFEPEIIPQRTPEPVPEPALATRPSNKVHQAAHVPAKASARTPPPAPKNPPARASNQSSHSQYAALSTNDLPASHSEMKLQAPGHANARARAPVMQAGHHCPKPEYPKISRRLMEQGVVTLRFLLSHDGEVLQSEIEQTSGFSRLDIAARNALGRCQFRSSVNDRSAKPVWALIHYSWQLK